MKFIDHLSKEQIRKFNQLRFSIKEKSVNQNEFEIEEIPKTKVKEDLSLREIEELMGTRRDTYKRVRGAVRRK